MLCWPGWNWTLKKAFWILHWIRVLLQIPEFSWSWDHFQFLRLHQVFQVIKLLKSHRCSITSHSVTLYQSTKYLSSIWWNNPDVLVRCEYVIILLTRVFLLDLFNGSGFCQKSLRLSNLDKLQVLQCRSASLMTFWTSPHWMLGVILGLDCF